MSPQLRATSRTVGRQRGRARRRRAAGEEAAGLLGAGWAAWAAGDAGGAEFTAGAEVEQAAMSKAAPKAAASSAVPLPGRPRGAVTLASGPRTARFDPAPGVRC